MPKLCEVCLPGRIALTRNALVVEQRLAAAHALAVCDISAGVDHEPVEPRRELGLAAELAEPDAELGERLLSGVAGVFGIGEHLCGQALDARSVPLAERRQRQAVAVLRSLDQNRVTQLLVDERHVGPRVLTNLTALAQRRLHGG